MVAQVPGTREKVLFEAQAPAVSDALPATAMTFHQYNNLTITHPLVNLTKFNGHVEAHVPRSPRTAN